MNLTNTQSLLIGAGVGAVVATTVTYVVMKKKKAKEAKSPGVHSSPGEPKRGGAEAPPYQGALKEAEESNVEIESSLFKEFYATMHKDEVKAFKKSYLVIKGVWKVRLDHSKYRESMNELIGALTYALDNKFGRKPERAALGYTANTLKKELDLGITNPCSEFLKATEEIREALVRRESSEIWDKIPDWDKAV